MGRPYSLVHRGKQALAHCGVAVPSAPRIKTEQDPRNENVELDEVLGGMWQEITGITVWTQGCLLPNLSSGDFLGLSTASFLPMAPAVWPEALGNCSSDGQRCPIRQLWRQTKLRLQFCPGTCRFPFYCLAGGLLSSRKDVPQHNSGSSAY